MSDTPETNSIIRNAQASDHPPTRLAATLTVKCEKLERERDEAREALRKAIRFVEAYEPHSRGVEVDQNETLNIIRKALEETK